MDVLCYSRGKISVTEPTSRLQLKTTKECLQNKKYYSLVIFKEWKRTLGLVNVNSWRCAVVQVEDDPRKYGAKY